MLRLRGIFYPIMNVRLRSRHRVFQTVQHGTHFRRPLYRWLERVCLTSTKDTDSSWYCWTEVKCSVIDALMNWKEQAAACSSKRGLLCAKQMLWALLDPREVVWWSSMTKDASGMWILPEAWIFTLCDYNSRLPSSLSKRGVAPGPYTIDTALSEHRIQIRWDNEGVSYSRQVVGWDGPRESAPAHARQYLKKKQTDRPYIEVWESLR